MAFEKPFLSVSNHAVGLQCVNRALENNRALFEGQFNPNHSPGLGGGSIADPFLAPGRHDDPLVARSVYMFDVSSSGAYAALITGPFLNMAPPTRIQTGQWRIALNSNAVWLVKVQACLTGTSSGNARAVTCRVIADPNDNHIIVTTWNVSAGAREECDFTLVIYSDNGF
jgi:hypothetical protein